MNRLSVISLLLFFLPGYRSLSQDMSVSVELFDRPGSFAVIPEETMSLSVLSNFEIMYHRTFLVDGDPSDIDSFEFVNCDSSLKTCTINVIGDFSAPEVAVLFWFNGTDQEMSGVVTQNLTVLVRTDLNYSCASYPTPMQFSPTITSYSFTCQPPNEMNMNVTSVVWRYFRSEDEVENFLGGRRYMGEVITSESTFGFSGSMNETLLVNQSNPENMTNVVFFYVPSFSILSADNTVEEIPTGETSIYVVPEIITPQPEFSFEVLLNRASFNDILCETRAFPPAMVEWTLQSEDFLNGVNVASLNRSSFTLNNVGSLDSLTRTLNGVINMTNLQYDDDGNFTCRSSNRYGTSAQWARLRVKSPLRPLWPALGILGVTILVALFMSGSYLIEKVAEKQKRARINKSDSNSVDHSVEQGHRLAALSHRSNNGSNAHSKGKDSHHSAVKRLSSAKPLLEETTSTTL